MEQVGFILCIQLLDRHVITDYSLLLPLHLGVGCVLTGVEYGPIAGVIGDPWEEAPFSLLP